MAFLLDHLTAVIVGAVLLSALVFVQLRQQQTTVATTQRYSAQMQTAEFAATLQRDVENMRTREQTEAAFGGAYDFRLRRQTGTDGETYTRQFAFPTLRDPSLGSASPVALVIYETLATGDSVRVGQVPRPTYRVTRYEYSRADGLQPTGGAEGLIDFDVILVSASGAEIATGLGLATPARVKISAVGAPPAAPGGTDGGTTATTHATRHAETVRVLSAGATGGRPAPEAGPGGIPSTLPGDPLPTSPSAPTSPSTPPPTPTSTPTSPSPSAPTSPSAPPPPPPAPPPGRQI